MSVIIKDGAYDKHRPTVMYHNVFADGTLVASKGVGENAISGTTWDFWSGTGFMSLTVTLPDPVEVDCMFVDAHNLSTATTYITLQQWNGVAWEDVSTTTPTDNKAIMFVFKGVTSDQFRVFTGGVSSSGTISIGVLMLGKRLVFPQGVDQNHTAINHARRIEVLGGDSLTGQFTGQQIIKRSADTSVTFPLLDATWVDNDMAEFEAHYDAGLPFAFATNPFKYPNDMGYCQRPQGASELRPSYYEGGLYEEFTMALGVYQNV